MSEQTAISWCDSTFNPWMGCTRVSLACDGCYAERQMDHHWQKVKWGAGQPRVRTSAANWRKALLWEREHEAFALAHEGRRRRVFCASLADVFDNEVDPAWRADLFALIADTPHLDWLLLTKRIGNAHRMMPPDWVDSLVPRMPDNIWIGATVINQEEADRDIPKLLAVPARVRFLSIEPMLGPVDLTDITLRRGTGDEEHFDALYFDGDEQDEPDLGTATLGWVICGGESGPEARPMHPDWPRSLRDQCAAAGVPFHFKQWGEFAPIGPANARCDAVSRVVGEIVRGMSREDFPRGASSSDAWQRMYRVGTKGAGRLLDGIEHNGFPA